MKAIRRVLLDQDGNQLPQEEGEILTLTRAIVPVVRNFGSVNWRGLWTLTCKEVYRFTKIWLQTIVSPLVMTLLFYAVFSIGTGGADRMIGSVPYLQFLIPGLVMMTMAQSAFVSTSSSLIISKIQGNIVDTLMAPLSPMELTVAYTASGVLRGLVVGAVSLTVLWFIKPIVAFDMAFVAYHAIMGSMALALMGLITGILGDKFDHVGAIQNFIILPATFLSGTFFSLQSLPKGWEAVCTLNPFFYMIDGFRYGLTGHAEGQLLGGLAYLLFINMILFNIAYWLFARGTRLKP